MEGDEEEGDDEADEDDDEAGDDKEEDDDEDEADDDEDKDYCDHGHGTDDDENEYNWFYNSALFDDDNSDDESVLKLRYRVPSARGKGAGRKPAPGRPP